MANKNREKQKAIRKTDENIFFEPVIPAALVMALCIVWGFIAIKNYYRTSPINLDVIGWYFTYDSARFALSSFMITWLDYLGSFAVAAFIILSAYGIGTTLYRVLHARETADRGTEDMLFSLGIGFGALSLLTLAIGVSGFLYKSVMVPVLLVFSSLGLAAIQKIKRDNALRPPMQEKKRAYSVSEKTAVAVIVIACAVNLLGCLVPETFYDAQFYHLGVTQNWVLHHKVFSSPYIHQTNYPFNVQMLYMVALLLKNEIPAQLLHFTFGMMILISLIAFSRRYFSRTTALLAAAVFSTIPIVGTVIWKTAIELGLGMFEFLAFFAFMRFMAAYKEKTWGESRPWLLLCGMFIGFALGGKYTSILSLIAVLTVLGLQSVLEKEQKAQTLKYAFSIAITALLVWSPWLVRNYVDRGNPFFPFSWSGGKKVYLANRDGRTLVSDPPYFEMKPSNIVTLPWTLTMNEKLTLGKKKYGVTVQESFPGPVFLFLLPLLFYLKKYPLPMRLVAIYLLTYIVLWVIMGKAYMRFFIPSFALLSVFVVHLLLNAKMASFIRQAMVAIVLFMSLANTLMLMAIQKSMRDPLVAVLGIQTRDEFISTGRPAYPNPYYPALRYVNSQLPTDAKVLFLGDIRGYFSQRRYLTHGIGEVTPLVEYCAQSKTPDDLYARLRAEGITHLLLNVPEAVRLANYDVFNFTPAELKVLTAFWNSYVKEVYKDIGDLALPEKGLYSLKYQIPGDWKEYSKYPNRYVYVYELLTPEESRKPHPVPLNFFLDKNIYAAQRWEKLQSGAAER